jgi:DNA-binding Xre family transcriptional regulator
MRLSAHKVKRACQRRQLKLKEALAGAEVSRTAYYSLVRSDSVLPKSLLALADFLGIEPGDLLEQTIGPGLRAKLLLRKVERILAIHPEADRDNIRHTLLLLEEQPVERLERGLLRGGTLDIH